MGKIDRAVKLYSTPVLVTLNNFAQMLLRIEGKLDALLKGETKIMATEADLNAKLDLLNTAIANEIQTAKNDIAAAIAQGGTPAQISDATMARLDQMKTTLDEAFAAPAPAAA